MPDAHGNFKGISIPAAAWSRVFDAELRGLRNIVESDLDAMAERIAARKANNDKPTTNK